MSDYPFLISAPFLPLDEFIDVGPWRIGPLDVYTGPWLTDGFEQVSRTFLGSFRLANGEALTNPSIIVHTDTGADGTLPDESERRALALGIGFATIDANRYWEPDPGDEWSTATSDNADIWIQPIDQEHRRIAIERGLRVRVLAGGYRLEAGFTVQAPIEIHMPRRVQLDGEMAVAIRELAISPPGGHEREAEQVLVAINWLLKSWRNTQSVSWEDRVVLLKTAFEALLGKSRTYAAMPLLVELFKAAEQHLVDTLWVSDEPTVERQAGGNAYIVTMLEHWYGAFADARNAIVHSGTTGAAVLCYDEPDSPYCGPFPEIGDRVLREAITARLASLGFPRVCMKKTQRLILDGLLADDGQRGRNPVDCLSSATHGVAHHPNDPQGHGVDD